MAELKGWNYTDVFEALVAGNLPPGTDLNGRYEIGEMLGKGGVGLVYGATDHMLGEEVVLKILNPALASDPETVERFKREIRLCRKIAHPNVIRIYDIDELYGTLFISMELVRGTDLRALIRKKGRFDEKSGRELLRGMVAGLSAAHQLGIVHRDLKSQNVMVDEAGHVKLLDFGMARLLGSDNLTHGGDILGSPPYMSPEQAQGLTVDHRTDVYSLGIILFEMFTGRLPFVGETPLATVLLQIDQPPPRPSELEPGINPELDELILTCLAKSPEERFQTIQELLEPLDLQDGSPRRALHCSVCNVRNRFSAKYCESCGHELKLGTESHQPWFGPSDDPDPVGESMAAALTAAVVCDSDPRLPASLALVLEFSAWLQNSGSIAEFQRISAEIEYPGVTLPCPEQILSLLVGLRHFTNRGKMRDALRVLLADQPREHQMTCYLIAEVFSFLARQKSRDETGRLTLRSLLPLLRPRLHKVFSSEPWLVLSLQLLDDSFLAPVHQNELETRYSGQPGLVALHLLFGTTPQPNLTLEGFLEPLRVQRSGAWARTAASISAAAWSFWHGIESIPQEWIERQAASGLAWDLGRELIKPL